MNATICRRGIIIAAALAAAALPASAGAATTNVHPGPNAIQQAVNDASNGDTLKIHDGNYPESVNVTRKLTLKDAGDGRPTINGGCDAEEVIDILHGGVTLNGLKVKGAEEYTVNMVEVPSGTVRDVVLRETCDQAEYGINVYQAGHLDLEDNDGKGFIDAGIYVGGLQDIGSKPLLVKGNKMHGNNIGILVEFGADGLDVRVIDNQVNGNDLPGDSDPAGIRLRDNNDVLLSGNTANDNGDYGIHLDSGSDDNALADNDAGGNGSFDLFNEGDNCSGGGNSFGTTSGNALGPC